MAAKEENHYKLRCSLIGHSLDVRAVTISKSDIITASRDSTAILWTENPENRKDYIQKNIYKGHNSFVTSICSIVDNSEEMVATGSKDTFIFVYLKLSSEPLHKLAGHTDSVSCLTWKNGYLVSGSWDHTIRIWKDWKCINVLKKHTGPIWDLVILEVDDSGPSIISASADKTLKLWRNHNVTVTYTGHSDCVRGVSLISNDVFVSCSNDASLKLWNLSGDCLATCYGHSNFIYSVCSAPDKSFISGSEDRTLRVWDANGANTQTMYLPAQSVWDVKVLPNSDIVAGTSDGICRVFSRSLDRQADEATIASFEDNLSKFKVGVEGINKSDLPDKKVLNTPGKRDGQTIMVTEGDKILCYSWSQAKMEWESVGEVIGGSSKKVLYEGKEYDFVFDVDLDEGRVLKLPFNKGEDPYVVAQAFIHKNELPQDHLDEVANFITKNAGVSGVGSSTSDYYDPFTGGNRYVPGSSSSQGIGGDNPFTGNSRYVPQAETVSSQYFPQTKPLPFEGANREGILNKLKESNSKVSDPLSEEQMLALVNSVVGVLPDLQALLPLQNALQWDPNHVWPVLDILRLALRFEGVHKDWFKEGNRGEPLVSLLVQLLHPHSSPVNTQLLSLRCLSNMACHPPGRQLLVSSRDLIITAALTLSPFANKNLEIAASTLMINYSFIFYSLKSIEDQCQILSGAATIALSASEPEALFRSLVALGTLLSLGGDLIPLAESLDLKSVVENLISKKYLEKVQDCARDVVKCFHS